MIGVMNDSQLLEEGTGMTAERNSGSGVGAEGRSRSSGHGVHDRPEEHDQGNV